jgi:hypothetical protein
MEAVRTARRSLERFARDLDAGALSGAQAARLVVELGAIRRLTDGVLARAAKRVADTNAYARHGDRSAAEWCARVVGVGSGEAKRAIENAGRLESLPETDAAVRAGRLSAAQAELIASAAGHDPGAEHELLETATEGLASLREACIASRARAEDPDERSRRQHAARSLKMWNAADGMVEGHFKLTPEVGGGVKAAIEACTRKVFRAKRKEGEREAHDAYAADALAELVTGKTGEQKPVGYSAHVVVDHEALVRGDALPGEGCEIPGVGPVNAKWVRELLGEAFVTAIVKKGKDITTVAHLGRHIPAELHTAMVVSGRECSIEGCTGRDYLELDHCEVDHAKGGPTAKWNLTWLCAIHHRRKSRGWLLGPPDPRTGKRTITEPRKVSAASAA